MNEIKVLWVSRNARMLPYQRHVLQGFAQRRGAQLVLRECVENTLHTRLIFAQHIQPFRPNIVVAVAPLDLFILLVRGAQAYGYEVWKPEMTLIHPGCRGELCPNYDGDKDVLTELKGPDGGSYMMHYRFYRYVRIKGIVVESEAVAV